MTYHAILAIKSGTDMYITKIGEAPTSPQRFRKIIQSLITDHNKSFYEALQYVFDLTKDLMMLSKMKVSRHYETGKPIINVVTPCTSPQHKEKHKVNSREEFLHLAATHKYVDEGVSILVDMDKRIVEFHTLRNKDLGYYEKNADGFIDNYAITRDNVMDKWLIR